jgi:hypothetical protein
MVNPPFSNPTSEVCTKCTVGPESKEHFVFSLRLNPWSNMAGEIHEMTLTGGKNKETELNGIGDVI